MKSRIAKIDLWTLRIPLPVPVSLGTTRIVDREFAVAVIETADGLRGWGHTLTRGAPVEAIARECFAPLLMDQDSIATEYLWRRMAASTAIYGLEGLASRAISILDIAAWDLKAKRAGLPLFQLLGGPADPLPILVPAGYQRNGQSGTDLADEMRFYQSQGIRAVKLMLTPAELVAGAANLAEAKGILGSVLQFGNDFCGCGTDPPLFNEALRVARELDMSFVEDPFPLTQERSYEVLRRQWGGMVVTGESVSGLQGAARLAGSGSVDAVRWDATVCGGVTAWLKFQTIASAHHLPVWPHVMPEVHSHLVAATGQPFLETPLPAYETLGFAAVLDDALPIHGGMYHLPVRAGLGLEFVPAKAEAFKVRARHG